MKILFVCLGNICRSPAAEEIMRRTAADNGAEWIETDSAGIGNWHQGQLPDARMRKCGAALGYSFGSRARQVRQEDLDKFDLVVAMDGGNAKALRAMARTNGQRDKIAEMAAFATRHKGIREIPDPYYGGEDGFRHVISLLEDACEGLLRHIVSTKGHEDTPGRG